QDEVVLRKTSHRVCPDGHVHLAVVDAKIRVMPLLLRDRGHLVDEGHGVQEVVELKALADARRPAGLRAVLPAPHLGKQPAARLVVERGCPALAGDAALFFELHDFPPSTAGLNESSYFGSFSTNQPSSTCRARSPMEFW